MTEVPTIELNDGTKIPQLGFGVYQIDPARRPRPPGTRWTSATGTSTPREMYQNEAGVGQGIRDAASTGAMCSSPASSTMASTSPTTPAAPSTARSPTLGFDYVDLFLIHWPLPTLYDGDFVSTWQTLEEFKSDGRARSDRGLELPGRPPRAAGRRDRHRPGGEPDRGAPVLHQRRGRARHGAEHGIATEAWSPIAQGAVLDDQAVDRDRRAIGRTPAQVVLRWHIQRGDIVFPKSVTPARIKENFEIFDFELSPDDADALSELDSGEKGRTAPHRTSSTSSPD